MNNACLRYATNEQELHNMLTLPEHAFSCTRDCLKRYREIKNILDNYGSTLAQSNIRLGEYLGSGACGVVFEVKDKPIVMKVTYDINEVCLAELLKQRALENVCPIKEVFKFEGTPCYGILQKRMEKLSKEEDAVFIEIMESQPVKDIINRYIHDEIQYETMEHFVQRATQNIGSYYPIQQKQKANDAIQKILHAISSIKGFALPDLSKSNTMKNESSYCLIDMKLRDDKVSLREILDQVSVLRCY